MSNDYVNFELEDRIAVVTIDNPPVNALSMEVIDKLWETFESLNINKNVGVVIITGKGRAFVAGADITMFERIITDKNQGRVTVKRFQDCFTHIENFPGIVIAAVNGLALGGGCELAIACDFRIAADNAQFGLPEVRLGILPGAGGTQRLTRLLGRGMAKMMVLGGEPVAASEALRIGLVEKVVSTGEVLDEAKKLARTILRGGGEALRNAKRAINEGAEMSLDKGLQREIELISELFETEDFEEGAKAFLEKRKPDFKGK